MAYQVFLISFFHLFFVVLVWFSMFLIANPRSIAPDVGWFKLMASPRSGVGWSILMANLVIQLVGLSS
ncbi:hypothetical protein EUTSA_v10009280mg [Eutrema salsugineum]|uniref:Uncharacterized protein n=1 Tax=Eutrema salsugineum TaxID=72664 RepID=V4KVH4_EUTSA|nr:hypothetical protein EUTSA_v10009280mg [Eutrema salsugineum]